MSGMFDDVASWPGWAIPDGWTAANQGRCRSCDAEVLWCLTPAGKRAPLNRDGTSHFSNCPQAESWRRRA